MRTYTTPGGTSAWSNTSGANSSAATPLTTNTAVLMAASSGLAYYVTGLQFTAVTPGTVFLFNGASCIWVAPAAGNVPYIANFSASPLQGTVNTALTIQCLPSTANLVYNAQGFIGGT